MKKFLLIASMLIITLIFGGCTPEGGTTMFTLTSPELVEQGIIPGKYAMANQPQTSPPLNWSGVPEGTKSLTLTIVDPDVPLDEEWFPFKDMIKPGTWPGDLFVHWMVYDIPPSILALDEGASANLPSGIKQLNNSMGAPGYLGMGPPPGHKAHGYIFTLYALNVESLGLSAEAGYMDFINAMKGKILATAGFTAYYGEAGGQ